MTSCQKQGRSAGYQRDVSLIGMARQSDHFCPEYHVNAFGISIHKAAPAFIANRYDMKAMNYAKAESKKFEGDSVKGVTGRIAVGKQDGAEHFCMRVFEVEKGGFTPKHSHDWEHEIFFHQGKGEVLLGQKWEPVAAGSVAFIPGNREHQIRNKGDEKLVFVCLIPAGPPEL